LKNKLKYIDYVVETYMFMITDFHVSYTLYTGNIMFQLRIRLTPLTELLSSPPKSEYFLGQGENTVERIQEYNTILLSNTLNGH